MDQVVSKCINSKYYQVVFFFSFYELNIKSKTPNYLSY